MRHLCLVLLAAAGLGSCLTASRAADSCCDRPSCTDCDSGCDGVPTCKSSWEEKKTKKTKYTMKCEYACDRARESWCTDPAECRCSPPCGNVYVKKRLYKSEGEEKVEKVPKYEVKMAAAEPCDCPRCCGVCWWSPLSVLHHLLGH